MHMDVVYICFYFIRKSNNDDCLRAKITLLF